MRSLLILTLFCTAMIGCKSKEKSTTNSHATASETDSKTPVRPVIIDPDVFIGQKEIDYSVKRWEIVGDKLTVDVQYGGGCRDHNWEMYFNGAILKSMPPQAILHLRHTVIDGPDPCRGMPMETLQFDLSSLKNVASGELVVKWGGDAQISAVYRY
jgi:hypothetical protein